jgi:hypothetical protein
MAKNTTPERIREQIESLLRLAEDPVSTQEERSLALDRVTTLMEKYQVDASQLDPHSGQYTREAVITHVFTYPTSYGLNSTRGHGLFDVLKAMGGDGYVRSKRRGKGREEELVAYAAESTMNVLKVLIPSLTLQEANACAQYMKQVNQERRISSLRQAAADIRKSGGDAKDFTRYITSELRLRRKSFCLAFYSEAAERIRAKRKDAVQEAGRGYQLVLVDTAERIARELSAITGLRNQKARGLWSDHGWRHGSAAGAQAMVGQTELHGGRPALEK